MYVVIEHQNDDFEFCHSHWGLGQFFGEGVSLKFRGGSEKKRQSPGFRSPEVGISAQGISHTLMMQIPYL